MTSRRRPTMPQIGQALRVGLRTALHLQPARPSAPPRAVAPAVLASVAAVLGLVIATGTSAEARSLAGAPAGHLGAVSESAPLLANQADVARAMRAFGPPEVRAGGPARASRSSQRSTLHRWVRPNGGPLTSSFGYRWGRLHEGIDIAGPYGSPIYAVTDGCISYAGPEAGYGEVMKITDWDGSMSLYGHMSSFVKTSGCVKAGQEIARVGVGGDATGAHLHFGIYVGGAPINPIPYLAKRGLYI